MSRESAQSASASTTVGTLEAASAPCTSSVTPALLPRPGPMARQLMCSSLASTSGTASADSLPRSSQGRGKGIASSFFTAVMP